MCVKQNACKTIIFFSQEPYFLTFFFLFFFLDVCFLANEILADNESVSYQVNELEIWGVVNFYDWTLVKVNFCENTDLFDSGEEIWTRGF